MRVWKMWTKIINWLKWLWDSSSVDNILEEAKAQRQLPRIQAILNGNTDAIKAANYVAVLTSIEHPEESYTLKVVYEEDRHCLYLGSSIMMGIPRQEYTIKVYADGDLLFGSDRVFAVTSDKAFVWSLN